MLHTLDPESCSEHWHHTKSNAGEDTDIPTNSSHSSTSGQTTNDKHIWSEVIALHNCKTAKRHAKRKTIAAMMADDDHTTPCLRCVAFKSWTRS
eukprot:3556275-Pleurochrysis_carterae.AAC.4